MSAIARRIMQVLLGNGSTGTIRYQLTPATTGVPAVGVVLTSGAGAWGAYADLIAAGAITTEHWICGFYVNTAGAAQIFEIQVRDATPATLTEVRFDPTAVTPNLGYLPAGPFPIWRTGSAQSQARAGGTAAKVIGVSTLYSTGL